MSAYENIALLFELLLSVFPSMGLGGCDDAAIHKVYMHHALTEFFFSQNSAIFWESHLKYFSSILVFESFISNAANWSLKVVVHVLNKFGAGQTKWSTFMYMILGPGRKSGGASATGATPSLAPLNIN